MATTVRRVADEIDRFFAEASDEVTEIARAARRLVLDVRPDAVETLDRGNRIVGYGTGPRAMKDLWAGLAPHGRHVNLQLANGALIEDPDAIIEGTGKRIRHIKLHTLGDVDRPPVRQALARSLARHLAD